MTSVLCRFPSFHLPHLVPHICCILNAQRYFVSVCVCSLIIRIPCIFNVLKANQLFPSSIFLFPLFIHFCYAFIYHDEKYNFFRYARRNSFQIRVVFLYWLPCLLRMSRPGQESYECAPIPSSGNSEKTKQMNEVELRERYVDIYERGRSPSLHRQLKIVYLSTQILIAFDRFLPPYLLWAISSVPNPTCAAKC